MRKAVVDVDETLTHICTIDFDGDDGEPIDLDTCKLTKEDIETMAKEFYHHLHDNKMMHLLYCDEEVEIFIAAQKRAAVAIGIEVED